MQAVFHSRVGFQGEFVVLHASSGLDSQRQQVVVSFVATADASRSF
jgi:hypothetical protein